jgi:zinc protease
MVAAQTKLVEKVTKKGDELVIPYEKYVLFKRVNADYS